MSISEFRLNFPFWATEPKRYASSQWYFFSRVFKALLICSRHFPCIEIVLRLSPRRQGSTGIGWQRLRLPLKKVAHWDCFRAYHRAMCLASNFRNCLKRQCLVVQTKYAKRGKWQNSLCLSAFRICTPETFGAMHSQNGIRTTIWFRFQEYFCTCGGDSDDTYAPFGEFPFGSVNEKLACTFVWKPHVRFVGKFEIA